MNRKRLLIIAGAVLATAVTGFLGGFGFVDWLFASDEGPARVADGEELYNDIMGRHPLLIDRSSFEPGAEDAGSEVNKMRLPRSEWAELEQQQKNSLAKYLESMGAEWRIEVGPLSKDGQRIRSLNAVMTSDQWRDVVK